MAQILFDPGYTPRATPIAAGDETKPFRDDTDRKIYQIFAERGGAPVGIWTAIAEVVRKRGTVGRGECRRFRIDLLRRLARLRATGHLISAGRGRMRIPSVAGRASEQLGSHLRAPAVCAALPPAKPVAPELLKAVSRSGPAAAITKSEVDRLLARDRAIHRRSWDALPSPAEAGRDLRGLVGQPRRRTGKIGGRWVFRDQAIRLADGRIGFVYAVLRGRIAWNLAPGNRRDIEPGMCGVARVENVKLAKNSAAVALGKLKRGTVERPSELKAASARRNGTMPCRMGRMRGRPSNKRPVPFGLPSR